MLSSRLTREHRVVLARYLADSLSLSYDDWRRLRSAIDLLSQSTVTVNDETLTFSQFYDRFVDQPYADDLIAQLDAAAEPMSAAPQLQADLARRMVADMEEMREVHATDAERKLLLAFCLYWWGAFVRGYAFEIATFRDLTVSGLAFTPHDYRRRGERRSFCDFFVGGFAADVKLSTYFLAEARAGAAHCDVYITRLFDPQQRRGLPIVVLSETAWQAIDGDTTPAPLEQVARLLPDVACRLADDLRWVVLDYDRWKAMVLARQRSLEE
jgi:hypothetical protein